MWLYASSGLCVCVPVRVFVHWLPVYLLLCVFKAVCVYGCVGSVSQAVCVCV